MDENSNCLSDLRIGGAIHDIPKPVRAKFAQILLTLGGTDLRMRVLLVSLIRFYWLTDLHDNTTRISLSLNGHDRVGVGSPERSGKVIREQSTKPCHVGFECSSYSPSAGIASGGVDDGSGWQRD